MISHNLNIDLSIFPTLDGVYLVGGTVRDLLLGLTPVDYDIAVTQNPEIFAEKTAAACHGRLVRMGRAGKSSCRVVTGDTILDITGVDGPTIRQDLNRRDVTVNAMAWELSTATLVDRAGGQRDLAEKRIRMVSEQGFRDDPVRLLRVFRLAATLGFSIEDQTLAAIARNAPLIRRSAGERIRSELCQLFSCRDSALQVDLMLKTGLLQIMLPASVPGPAPGDAVPNDACHRTRFLSAYRHLEKLLNHPPPGCPHHVAASDSPDPLKKAVWLKLALILIRHNFGPAIRTAGRPDGDAASGGRDKIMAAATEAVCCRLRLSARERDFVTGIVRHHSRPFHLHGAHVRGDLTPTRIARFFMAVGTLAPHLLLCTLAEARDIPRNGTSFSNFVRRMLHAYYETYLPGKARPPFVSGRDLVRVFGLPPSPLFQKILTRLEEGRLAGEITDRATALEIAEGLIRT